MKSSEKQRALFILFMLSLNLVLISISILTKMTINLLKDQLYTEDRFGYPPGSWRHFFRSCFDMSEDMVKHLPLIFAPPSLLHGVIFARSFSGIRRIFGENLFIAVKDLGYSACDIVGSFCLITAAGGIILFGLVTPYKYIVSEQNEKRNGTWKNDPIMKSSAALVLPALISIVPCVFIMGELDVDDHLEVS